MDVKTDPAASLRYLRRDPGGRVRRHRGGPRRAVLFAAVFFLAGVGAGTWYAARHYLLSSPRFRLRRIAFTPTRHAPQDELRRTLSPWVGRNLFRLDLSRLERAIEERRWVRRAVVKRVLPDGLHCAVEERVPRALGLIDGRVWLLDGDGARIDPHGEDGTRSYSFPVFLGLDGRNEARAREQARRGVALLDYLRSERPALLEEISEVDLSRDDRVELRLEGGGPAVRLHPEEFGANLDRYLAMREFLTTGFGDGAYVDLRFRDRIAFRPLLAKGQ